MEDISRVICSRERDTQMGGQRIVRSAGFGIQQSGKTRNIGYQIEQAPTIIGGSIHGVVYELSDSDKVTDGEQADDGEKT